MKEDLPQSHRGTEKGMFVIRFAAVWLFVMILFYAIGEYCI